MVAMQLRQFADSLGIREAPWRQRRKWLFYLASLSAALFGFAGLAIVASWPGGDQRAVGFAGAVAAVATSVTVVAYMHCARCATDGADMLVLRIYAAVLLASAALYDLHAATTGGVGGSAWYLFLPLVQAILMLQLGAAFDRLVLFACAAWVVLTTVEASTRFGLYDAADDGAYGQRLTELCGCQHPPCMVYGVAAICRAVVQLVALLSCAFTALCAQPAPETMATVTLLTEDLIRLQVDEADNLLDANPCLHLLGDSFRELVNALRLYRAYIPGHVVIGEPSAASITERNRCEDSSDIVQSNLPLPGSIDLVSTPHHRRSQSLSAKSLRLSKRSACPASSILSLGGSVAAPPPIVSPTADSQSFSALGGMLGQDTESEVADEGLAVLVGPSAPPMKQGKATLLVLNMRNSLVMLDEQQAVFEANHSLLVAVTVLCVTEQKGLVDMLAGDHLYASFNASKACQKQSMRSIQSALNIYLAVPQIPINLAAYQGNAWCGNLGSSQMRRFAVLGKLPRMANAVERVGARFNIPILACSSVQSDAYIEHEMRLHHRLISFDGVCQREGKPVVRNLWEVIVPSLLTIKSPRKASCADEEWMYALGNSPSTKWERYNEAIAMYLQEKSTEDIVAKVGDMAGVGTHNDEDIQTLLGRVLDTPLEKHVHHIY